MAQYRCQLSIQRLLSRFPFVSSPSDFFDMKYEELWHYFAHIIQKNLSYIVTKHSATDISGKKIAEHCPDISVWSLTN